MYLYSEQKNLSKAVTRWRYNAFLTLRQMSVFTTGCAETEKKLLHAATVVCKKIAIFQSSTNGHNVKKISWLNYKKTQWLSAVVLLMISDILVISFLFSGCIDWHGAPLQGSLCPLPTAQSRGSGWRMWAPCDAWREPRLGPYDFGCWPPESSAPRIQTAGCSTYLQAR